MTETPAPEGADRYARQRILPGFGEEAQRSLERGRVLVIGAGGLGSSVIPALAAAGVGTIGIIDDDTVETSNLHRQYVHGVADVGRPKVDSAADAVAALNPRVRVIAHPVRLTADNALGLFAGYDLVIDGSDNFPTRYLANDAAALTGIPLVWGAVSQYSGQAGVCWAARGPQYRDLFPTPPAPGTVLSCAVGGVLPTVCAVIGSILATETIKILTGVGTPLVGRVTTFDALTGAFREIAYARDPEAAPIRELIDYDVFCGIAPPRETVTAVELAAELAAKPAVQPGVQPGSQPGVQPRVQPRVQPGSPGAARPILVDVREPWEVELVTLPADVYLPLGSIEVALERGLTELDPADSIVLYCHHGVRSASALETLERYGFTAVRHLEGGIDAWSRQVDPSVARY